MIRPTYAPAESRVTVRDMGVCLPFGVISPSHSPAGLEMMGGMVIGWLLGIVVLILVVFALIKYLRSK